jgi:hypothetical protein
VSKRGQKVTIVTNGKPKIVLEWLVIYERLEGKWLRWNKDKSRVASNALIYDYSRWWINQPRLAHSHIDSHWHYEYRAETNT